MPDPKAPLAASVEAAWRRGDYSSAEALAEHAGSGAGARQAEAGEVLLQRVKGLAASGRIRTARALLTRHRRRGYSPSLDQLLELEAARLDFVGSLVVGPVLTLGRVRGSEINHPSDAGEIEFTRCQLLLHAAVIGEVGADEKQDTADRLLAVASSLEAASQPAAALRARLTALQARQQDPPEAFEMLAGEAERGSEFTIAGKAWLALAERMISASAAEQAISPVLDRAAESFARAQHRHGAIDVALARARAKQGRADPRDFECCIDAYHASGTPNGEMYALLALSSTARAKGDMALEQRCIERIRRLADEHGNRLLHASGTVTELERMFADGKWSRAVERCEKELGEGLPAAYEASMQLMMANALAQAGDPARALPASRRALHLAEAKGLAMASQAASRVVADLAASRPAGWQAEAFALLERRASQDIDQGDRSGAIRLLTQAVSVAQVLQQAEQPAAQELALAADWLDRAAVLAEGEPAPAKLLVLDARTLLALMQGDTESWGCGMEEAAALCDAAERPFHAAQYRHMLGSYHFNAAETDLRGHFGRAEDLLVQAAAGMRSIGYVVEAVRCDEKRARLYGRAAKSVQPELARRLEAEALRLLEAGEQTIDLRRRDYRTSSVLATREGKRSLTRNADTLRTTALTMLLRGDRDPTGAFDWAQRGKSRQLNDLLGAGTKLPAEMHESLESDPQVRALLAQEAMLLRDQAEAALGAQADIRVQLDALRERMASHPALADYLALRDGAVDAARARKAYIAAAASPDAAFVDWISVGSVLFILVARGDGEVQSERLRLTLEQVTEFVRLHLGPDRFASTLARSPHLLRVMDALVAPLAYMVRPGDRLVLCPTASLHALPLHALEMGGEPLLVRHTISYAPSLGILEQCLALNPPRRGVPAAAALFGNPGGDRSASQALLTQLGQRFGTSPAWEEEVTRAAVLSGCRTADLLHFHGHAVAGLADGLLSHLVLAGHERLTAAELFELRGFQPRLVVLCACEGAASLIELGDEPIGMAPAFLVAGASAVIAAQWRVGDRSAALLMERFYAGVDADGPNDLAAVLRNAALAVRAEPTFAAPYHWAPFILQGDWRWNP